MNDRRAKKACTECRQQKARCDAQSFDDGICSRCRKMRLNCVMSDSFEREHKRRKLSEIERENIRLRQQLDTSKVLTPRSNDHISTPERSQTVTKSPEDRSFAGIDMIGCGRQGTVRRMLDGIRFEAEEIDQLFEIFFREFSWFLPILDPTTTPNAYHATSPFLFWTLIGVASRDYPQRAMSLNDLRNHTLDLALSALISDASVQSIQAMLVLLTWPFPKTHRHPDISSQLNGATIHMAMQMGLHIPISSHEYSRVRLQLTPSEIDKRAELWGHIIVTYQRVCLAKGIPANTVRDLTLDPEQRISLLEKVPGDIKSQFQIQSILTRCGNEAAKLGLRMINEDRERALDIVLRVHEREIENVFAPQTVHARLCLLIGRVTIQALHLFKSAHSLAEDELLLAKLTINACEWIETCAQELETLRLHGPAVPFYYVYAILTCYSVLIRILKVPLFCSKVLDVERAKKALLSGTEILKKLVLEENDTASRSVTILQQLWESKKAYLRPNGQTGELEPVPLRIRSRIAMCHLLDTWAWWREEFGGPGKGFSGIWPPPLPGTNSVEKGKEANGSTVDSAVPRENVSVLNNPAAGAPTADLTLIGTQAMCHSHNPMAASVNAPGVTSDFTNPNINGFAQAQLDPNFGNLIGDDMFSDLWSYWPDSHSWTTGLT